ncbi:MAG: twin-arginine translocation signal domain-containing protein [Acidobacteria bacterium]|nr:twin-arginine translocation signal domain-containing protein [Acidobacteriota bacterium]
MKPQGNDRRRFLQGSAAVLGMAAAGVKPAVTQGPKQQTAILPADVRPLGERSPFVKSYRIGSATDGLTPLQDIYGIITPSDLHFYVNHEYGAIPVIDPEKYRLLIHGMVNRPVMLTLDEIKLLPSVTRVNFIECGGNGNLDRTKAAKTVQETHGRSSCTEWTGVPLSVLLKEVGVKQEGTWAIAVSEDTANHAISIPMAKCMEDVLVAYGQNGEPLRLEQGYPLRLVVPGWTGRIHVKWLNHLKITNQPYMTTQEDFLPGEGLPFEMTDLGRRRKYETYSKSVITFPSGGHKLTRRGPYEISGLAWSGAGRITKVEVSTDDGKTWKTAELQAPVLPRAFTRFRLPWQWDGRSTVVQSRATDEIGNVQPTMEAMEKNWFSNPECVDVNAKECKRIPQRANRSLVQRWKIGGDGLVQNGFEPTKGILEIGSLIRLDEHNH